MVEVAPVRPAREDRPRKTTAGQNFEICVPARTTNLGTPLTAVRACPYRAAKQHRRVQVCEANASVLGAARSELGRRIREWRGG